nr:ATP-dependent Clp protease adaptor ClpS [Rappaport israeli]
MKVLPVSPIQPAPLTTDNHPDEPSLYEILMLNDDFTTMDFVIDVLIRFFIKAIKTRTA